MDRHIPEEVTVPCRFIREGDLSDTWGMSMKVWLLLRSGTSAGNEE